MTDDTEAHVPASPDIAEGPTIDEAKNVADALTQAPLADAADLPTDVKDGDPSEVTRGDLVNFTG